MDLTRRNFTKGMGTTALFLAVTGGAALTMSGCNVFADIEAWVPVGTAAFNSIIILLETAGLINPAMLPVIAAIRLGFTDILADVKAYQNIQPPPVGALAKIEAVFGLLVGNFQGMLAQLQVTGGPVVTLVISLAQVILSTIAGFLGQLPVSKSLLTGTFKVGAETISYTAKHRNVRQFKKDWNTKAVAGNHPELKFQLSFMEHF